MGDLTRSCLINARDLGRGWKTTQRWYEPKWKVKRPLIDGGIEEDGAHCATVVLMASPDGVKQDFASHLLTLESSDARVSLRTAAVIFPAETNARARADAYARSIRSCRDEMRSVHGSWAIPGDTAHGLRVTTEQLALPVDAFGLRTVTRWSSRAAGLFDYQDVIIRRGRMIAGFSIHGYVAVPIRLDVARLATIIANRLDAAGGTLRPSRIVIPIYAPSVAAERAARSALTKISDYPARWRDHKLADYGYTSSTSVLPGSLRNVLDTLRPEPGMIGRAVNDSSHVGWSNYISHHVAVYASERRAGAAAKSAFENSVPFGNARRRRRGTGRVSARIIEMPALDRDVLAEFRIKTWRMPAFRDNPATDVTSTDAMAVIRRGRMVATWALAAKGEDVKTAYRLLKMVVRKLERAERTLVRDARRQS